MVEGLTKCCMSPNIASAKPKMTTSRTISRRRRGLSMKASAAEK
jgi:hypothetical protein